MLFSYVGERDDGESRFVCDIGFDCFQDVSWECGYTRAQNAHTNKQTSTVSNVNMENMKRNRKKIQLVANK